MTSGIADLYVRTAEHLETIVAQIGQDDWDRPTPCTEWDVTALVEHVLDEQRWAGPLLDGLDMEEAGRVIARSHHPGDGPGGDLIAAFRVANQQALAAARRTASDVPVQISRGQVTAGEFLEEMFADQLIHSWDLAAALGFADDLPADLVSACAGRFTEMEDQWRASGAIGPRMETADDADPQTRLLAAFGRVSPWPGPT